jgi:WD40 repeat protein
MSKLKISFQREFKGHKQSVYTLVSDGGEGFFTAGSDGFIVHWSSVMEEDGRVFARVPEAVFSLYYDEIECRVLAGGQYGNIYQLEKGKSPKILKMHEGSVFWVGKFGSDYLSLSAKGDVVQWTSQERIKKRMVLSTQSLRYAQQEGDFLWVTGSEGRLWELDAKLELRSSHLLGSMSWFKLASTPKWVYAVGRDAKLHRWNRLFLDHAFQDAHWYSVHGLCLSPDGKILATGSMDKSIRLWDADTLNPLGSVHADHAFGHKSSVNDFIWLNPQALVSVSDDASVRCWKVEFHHE